MAQAHDPTLAEIARTGCTIVAVDVGRAAPGMLVTSQMSAAHAVLSALGIPASVAAITI